MKKFKIPLFLMLLIISIDSLQANENVEKLTQAPNNWTIWGENYAATRYSRLDEINAQNVKKLQASWTFSTEALEGYETGVLVVNDVVYIRTGFPNTVYALDPKTQTVIWQYKLTQDPETFTVTCCHKENYSLAYAQDKIFLQQTDNTLVALNANPCSVILRPISTKLPIFID